LQKKDPFFQKMSKGTFEVDLTFETEPPSSLEISRVPISTQGNTRILKGGTTKLSGFQFPPIRVRGNTSRPLFSKIPLKG
jgi:hypothetical protein